VCVSAQRSRHSSRRAHKRRHLILAKQNGSYVCLVGDHATHRHELLRRELICCLQDGICQQEPETDDDIVFFQASKIPQTG